MTEISERHCKTGQLNVMLCSDGWKLYFYL